jgi:hypothetical protein
MPKNSAEYMRQYRAKKKLGSPMAETAKTIDESEVVSLFNQAQTRVADLEAQRRDAGLRINELADEVKRLKQRLASRPIIMPLSQERLDAVARGTGDGSAWSPSTTCRGKTAAERPYQLGAISFGTSRPAPKVAPKVRKAK